MKEIDWSKAPEDATHYQPAYEVFDNPVFWRIVNGVAREVWTVGSLDEDINYHFTYGTEGNDCYIPERCIERPIKTQEQIATEEREKTIATMVNIFENTVCTGI